MQAADAGRVRFKIGVSSCWHMGHFKSHLTEFKWSACDYRARDYFITVAFVECVCVPFYDYHLNFYLYSNTDFLYNRHLYLSVYYRKKVIFQRNP